MIDFYRPHQLWNPFGGSNSSAATTSVNVSATGAGKAANAPNAVQTGDSSIAVGQGGQYRETGSLDLSGVKGNISINDPTAFTQLASDFAATTKSIASSSSSANLAANQNFLAGLQSLAQSQQSGGFTPVMKTFLWLALGGIGLLAFIFRRK